MWSCVGKFEWLVPNFDHKLRQVFTSRFYATGTENTPSLVGAFKLYVTPGQERSLPIVNQASFLNSMLSFLVYICRKIG